MAGYAGPAEPKKLQDTWFRQRLFTSQHAQLVVMCLHPGEEIGAEAHRHVDQYFRIEEGEARFILNRSEDPVARHEEATLVPAGKYHNGIDTSKRALPRFYNIYSPPNNPDGTIHKTKAEAKEAEAAQHQL